MPESSVLPDASAAPPLPRPTPVVWMAIFLGLLACLWNFAAGLAFLVHDLGKWPWEPPVFVDPPFLNPFLVGLLSILVSVLIGWCLLFAVLQRSKARSYFAAAVFFVVGMVGCMGPWDTVRDLVFGSHLFVGVVMWRWGRKLARHSTETTG